MPEDLGANPVVIEHVDTQGGVIYVVRCGKDVLCQHTSEIDALTMAKIEAHHRNLNHVWFMRNSEIVGGLFRRGQTVTAP